MKSLIEKCDGTTEATTIKKCIEIMIEKNIDLLPIVDKGNKLVGVVTEQDFAKIVKVSPSGWTPEIIGSSVAKGYMNNPISSIMSREIVYVKNDENFESLVQKMLSKNTYKRLPVVDHDHRLVGFVRLVDVINKMME